MILSLAFAFTALVTQVQAPKEVVDPSLHPEQIVFGQMFASGPVWTPSGHLLWSDTLGDVVYELEGAKAVPVTQHSQRANGHAFDLEGRLVSCLGGARSVVRRESSGQVTTLANSYEGKKLNGPSDLAIRSDGSIYFTDPAIARSSSKPELGFSGLFRIAPNGKLEVVTKDLIMPTGLAFSLDERQLYVSDPIRHYIRVYDVAQDGSVSNGKVFAYQTGELAGAPGGIKVDAKGDVFCAGPGGVQVFDSSAKYLGLIFVRDAVTNFCFGDADRKTLYITAIHGIYRIRLKIAGK